MIAIIQARLGSTRLPDKVLQKIGDKTMLEHVIDRVKKLPVDKIIVAVSCFEDYPIMYKIDENYKDVDFYHAPDYAVNDVLKRFVMCGITYDADYILRVCSDMPFFSIPAAKELIENTRENFHWKVDCTENCDWNVDYSVAYDYVAHYLKGEDTPTVWKYAGNYVEVVRLAALFDIHQKIVRKEIEGTINYDGTEIKKVDCFKEHPTSGIYLTPQRYKIKRIMVNEVPEDTSINTQEDLDRVRRLYECGQIK